MLIGRAPGPGLPAVASGPKNRDYTLRWVVFVYFNRKICKCLGVKKLWQSIQTIFVLRVFEILIAMAVTFAPKFEKIAKNHEILMFFEFFLQKLRSNNKKICIN
jgi:hypothetical protein